MPPVLAFVRAVGSAVGERHAADDAAIPMLIHGLDHLVANQLTALRRL